MLGLVRVSPNPNPNPNPNPDQAAIERLGGCGREAVAAQRARGGGEDDVVHRDACRARAALARLG